MSSIKGALCALCLAGSALAAPLDPSTGLHIDPSSVRACNHPLAERIVTLFNEDQVYLERLGQAKHDPAFQTAYSALAHTFQNVPDKKNFYSDDLYRLWASEAYAPDIVRRYSAFRELTNAEVHRIVTANGWPTRRQVGDQAAAGFFFLFGHADHDNAWRETQLQTIERVFEQDHLNPRLYAHMVDRITDLSSGRQRFGTIMGPAKSAGGAELYALLINDIARTDRDRAKIGLPSIEADLEKFRKGAQIGPYMTPLDPQQAWDLSEVYSARPEERPGLPSPSPRT